MRVGATIFNQNYTDWDRYEAEERGESVDSVHGALGAGHGDASRGGHAARADDCGVAGLD